MPTAYVHLRGAVEGRARVAAEVALRLMLPIEALRTQIRARERIRDEAEPVARADRMNLSVLILTHGHEFSDTLRNSRGDISNFIDLDGDPRFATRWTDIVQRPPNEQVVALLRAVRNQLGSHWSRESAQDYLNDVVIHGRFPPLCFTSNAARFLDTCYLWPADAFVSWLRRATNADERTDEQMFELLDQGLRYIGELLALGSELVPALLDAAGVERTVRQAD